ncbi:MAG TPA: succinylglutamate desuccinylase/aspartoacylase family protein [Bauldia sp.]|nr:succinylglutamate desuccinylase/aspartoacylase family protein [Bauldia sp.]
MGHRIADPRPTTAFATVDFDKPGKQVGFVMIPHSPHDDAWGVTRIPIAVIAGGTGPTAIVSGGNHGDEYEGPIVISEMIRELDPDVVSGRIILMPSLNAPAAFAGTRTSPIDGKNFNRTFPGNPHGTMTEQISAYLCDSIFPIADAFVDLHSGGSSLSIIPSAIVEPTLDRELEKKNIAAALAFGAPKTVVIANLGDPRTSTAAACRAGLVTVGTEMGGGGTVSPEALRICRQGVRNLLAHHGILPPTVAVPPRGDAQVLELPGADAYVFASMDGVFEPFHQHGREVRAGEPAGRIHAPWDPAREPDVLTYRADGILYGIRQPGRVKPGNCCLVVASPYGGTLP